MSHVLARDLDSPCVLLGIALLWSIMSGFQVPHQSYFSLRVPKNIAQRKMSVEFRDLVRHQFARLVRSERLPTHKPMHEFLYLRQVDPLNGGGAAKFGSGAANLFAVVAAKCSGSAILSISQRVFFHKNLVASVLVARD